MSSLNVAICTTISYTLWVEWYYLKNHYLTLRSNLRTHEGHDGTRHTALWSCTHIPNSIDLSRKTKMLWPDKKILFKKQLFDLEVKGQGPTKVTMVCDAPHYGHAPTYQINTIEKTIIWPWGQRSRSHEGHYGMLHIALWSCTHIPNIIDLSGKTKKLWSGQASLRRSRRRRRSGRGRRKNQSKTICLPSFKGET